MDAGFLLGLLRTYVPTFLFGGLAGTLATQWISDRRVSRKDEADFLSEQVRILYGPLCYLVRQNDRLFALSARIDEGHTAEYVDKRHSQHEMVQNRVRDASSKTIEMYNEYTDQIMRNNDSFKAVVDANFGLADPDDMELLTEFAEHYTRLRHEESKKLPLEIQHYAGPISYMKPELIARVKDKHSKKIARILRLKGMKVPQEPEATCSRPNG